MTKNISKKSKISVDKAVRAILRPFSEFFEFEGKENKTKMQKVWKKVLNPLSRGLPRLNVSWQPCVRQLHKMLHIWET